MNFVESNFAQRVEDSKTLAVTGLVAELRAQGRSIIDLGAGEPDFGTPEAVSAAGILAIQQGQTKYTPNTGTLALRETICAYLQKEFQADYQPGNIVVSNGAKQCVHNAILAICNPGDEVIIPTPYWVSYSEQVKMAQAVPKFIAGEEANDFKITPEQLANAITDKTKLVIFNNPGNPTGSVYSPAELRAIAAVITEHKVLVVSDEIYIKLVYEAQTVSLGSVASLRDRLLLVNGFSKTWSMTGWRLGFVAAPPAIAKAIAKIQSHTTSNACSISQAAGIAALQMSGDVLDQMKSQFQQRRNYVYEELNSMPGISTRKPGGAFYILPNIGKLLGRRYDGRSLTTPEDLAMALAQKAGVAVVAGEGFGAPQHVRISYATSMANLQEAMRRLRHAAEEITQSASIP